MHCLRSILVGFGCLLAVARIHAQAPVLIKEVVTRECSINVGALQVPEVNEMASQEVGVFVGNEPEPPYRQVVSRDVSLVVADPAAPPPVTGMLVTVSPTGGTVTLDWSSYNQWQVRDVKHYAVYFANAAFTSVAGMTPVRIVPGEQLTTTFTGLPEWQDHFFAVVAVDALDHADPVVNYAAAYVLMPELVTREVGLFTGAEPEPPFKEIASREIGLVTVDDAPPLRITDLQVTVSPTGSTVTLDWSSYNQYAVGDVARYDIYVSASPITDITGLAPEATVGGEVFQWTKTGLPEWQDRFFAVVPVDGLGNLDPVVEYSAAYVLMPEVVSREMGLFIGGEPVPPYRETATREVSLVVADETVPEPVTGIGSGFAANTAAARYAAIDLDWSSYNEAAQRDVVRYRVYVAGNFFDNVTGMTPRHFTAGQTFTVTELVGEAIYYLAVVAEDSSGNFSPVVYSVSAQASVAKLGDVTNVVATPQLTRIAYSWELGGSGGERDRFIDHFHIYFAGSATPAVVDKEVRTWTATGLTPGHTYAARFTTVDVFGFESAGVTVVATTGAVPQPLAYWRFEEGAADSAVRDSAQNTLDVDPVLDSSGNGNELRTWDTATAPTYRSSVMAPQIPNTGAANTRCLEFTPNDELYEFNQPMRAHELHAFTIEASFAPDNLSRWQTIVGRDGNAAGSTPSVRLMLRDDNDKFMIEVVDDTGAFHNVQSLSTAVAGHWHQLTATYDGTSLALYLRGPGDSEAVLQGTVTTGGGVKDMLGTWTVGRGWSNGSADWAAGRIDEVRIVPEALPPTHFLQAASPWQQWLTANFSAAEQLDPALSGELADPDGDGIVNLVEYGMGTAPRSADPGVFSLFNNAPTGLTLNYSKNTAAPDVVLSFEVSTTLQPGSWQAATSLSDWMLAYSGTRQVRRVLMAPVADPRVFYRLKVSRLWPRS